MHDYTAAKQILERHGLSTNQPNSYWQYSCNGNKPDANAELINAVNDELAALKIKPESNGSEQN